eukprot:121668-Amorphochlora_amoeboformis.AAC.2
MPECGGNGGRFAAFPVKISIEGGPEHTDTLKATGVPENKTGILTHPACPLTSRSNLVRGEPVYTAGGGVIIHCDVVIIAAIRTSKHTEQAHARTLTRQIYKQFRLNSPGQRRHLPAHPR